MAVSACGPGHSTPWPAAAPGRATTPPDGPSPAPQVTPSSAAPVLASTPASAPPAEYPSPSPAAAPPQVPAPSAGPESVAPPQVPASSAGPESVAPPTTVLVHETGTAATAQAVADAYAVGAERTNALAIALLDLQSGELYSAGDIDETYASASLVKVFIAARLLAEGQADDLSVRDRMWRMITVSDDDAGSYLYGLAGGEGLVPWIADRYGVPGLAPADRPGYWGLTRVTARGIVAFYAAVLDDPAVAPWLLDAMDQAQAYGSDGFYQYFGLPAAADSWRVKQGWMCCLDNLTRMHSTGYIDGDRYAVALLAAGPASMYGDAGAQTLTLVARALLPTGTVPS